MTARRGAMLLEAVLATSLLVVAFASIAQLLVVVTNQRREVARRVIATREAANIMERVIARPWEQVNQERLSALDLSPAAERLPDPRLQIQVSETTVEAVVRKRVHLRLVWRNSANLPAEPVELEAWKFKHVEAE